MEAWRAPPGAVEALLAARHGDPFAVLGPHAAPGGLVIRALVPDVEALWVVPADGSAATPLPRRDGAFFEGLLPGRALPFGYRLRAERHGGAWEFEDPYRFGETLGPLDDHLMLEGTHRRLHQRLCRGPYRRLDCRQDRARCCRCGDFQ